MRLIINADDLGISRDVNNAIFDLMSRKIVTSATIMANAPLTQEALKIAREFPRCSFGVHLNLTEFKPLTNSLDLCPLLGADGEFDGKSEREVRMTSALREAVFHEWSAHIEHLAANGHVLSHLDSHHHVHTLPGLFLVLKRVQRKFGIRKVRATKNIYGPTQPFTTGLLLRKGLWNFALRYYFRTGVTRGFTSFQEFYDLVHDGTLGRWLGPSEQTNSVIELMVHPGNHDFQQENDLLTSGWIEDSDFSRVSFHTVT